MTISVRQRGVARPASLRAEPLELRLEAVWGDLLQVRADLKGIVIDITLGTRRRRSESQVNWTYREAALLLRYLDSWLADDGVLEPCSVGESPDQLSCEPTPLLFAPGEVGLALRADDARKLELGLPRGSFFLRRSEVELLVGLLRTAYSEASTCEQMPAFGL